VCLFVCVCVCVRGSVRACVLKHVRVHVHACMLLYCLLYVYVCIYFTTLILLASCESIIPLYKDREMQSNVHRSVHLQELCRTTLIVPYAKREGSILTTRK